MTDPLDRLEKLVNTNLHSDAQEEALALLAELRASRTPVEAGVVTEVERAVLDMAARRGNLPNLWNQAQLDELCVKLAEEGGRGAARTPPAEPLRCEHGVEVSVDCDVCGENSVQRTSAYAMRMGHTPPAELTALARFSVVELSAELGNRALAERIAAQEPPARAVVVGSVWRGQSGEVRITHVGAGMVDYLYTGPRIVGGGTYAAHAFANDFTWVSDPHEGEREP